MSTERAARSVGSEFEAGHRALKTILFHGVLEVQPALGNRCHRGRNPITVKWRGVRGRGGVQEPGVRTRRDTQGTREALLCSIAGNPEQAATGIPTAGRKEGKTPRRTKPLETAQGPARRGAWHQGTENAEPPKTKHPQR